MSQSVGVVCSCKRIFIEIKRKQCVCSERHARELRDFNGQADYERMATPAQLKEAINKMYERFLNHQTAKCGLMQGRGE